MTRNKNDADERRWFNKNFFIPMQEASKLVVVDVGSIWGRFFMEFRI